MSNIAIQVENLYKQYRLGTVGTGTLSHDLNRWWARIRGKADPFAKVGDVNDRTTKGDSKYVWALKDINFEVQQGDVVGIIGRNGAGKSTLLKILSKVTSPTQGRIKVNGRIASLLEVGTGFHQELTGRENIFLNGAILGMTKAEIKSKLEEIVEFAGVSRYIDTPVKRYSSGMTVRLAFAVAAHLEPEILVVDEVLAVGDAEFQKKAIGKMQEVSKGQGRTVLFVSHNMGAVRNLCNCGILINNGKVQFKGDVKESIQVYQSAFNRVDAGNRDQLSQKTSKYDFSIDKIEFLDPDNFFGKTPTSGEGLIIRTYYYSTEELQEENCVAFGIRVKNVEGVVLFKINTLPVSGFRMNKLYAKGTLDLYIPELPLNKGDYYLDVEVSIPNSKYLYVLENIMTFIVEGRVLYKNGTLLNARTHGPLYVHHQWGHKELKLEKI